ncbi:hypothetical protein F966_01976 [Acinetobacter higginsii]|uniref:Uncharacterized protein n=1 Tax=Acinetobacter higginsii TaxID=70347 RepID=N8XQH1_9GAMM|nr:hypothetical protein [Acinetobacter higginsii]ENV09320.1 hypothetical protein F966_01976 [Acinetobacter higginsii]
MSQFFNHVTALPKDKQQVVLQLHTGEIVSPVEYSETLKKFIVKFRNIRQSSIKGWAALTEVQKALNIPALSHDELKAIRQKELESIASTQGKTVNQVIKESMADLLV